MFMTFNPAPVPPEQPVSEQTPAQMTKQRPVQENKTESASVSVSKKEEIQTPAGQQPFFKGLEASVEGKVVKVTLPKEADFDHSMIMVNGTQMSSPEMILEEDGDILLSWQLCDAKGTILESSEKVLNTDFTGPSVSFNEEKDTLWITEEKELSFIVSDDSAFSWETFLDGKSLGETDTVLLQPGHQNLTVIAKDEHGNETIRSLKIMQAPRVLSEWAAQSEVNLKDGLLHIEFGGDIQGCFIRAEKNGISTDILCDSSSMDLSLPFEGEMTLTLVHPSLGDLQSWTITNEKKETVTEQQKEPVLEQNTQSGSEQTALFREERKNALLKPAAADKKPALELWSSKEQMLDGQRVYLSAAEPAAIDVRNGTLEKMQFSIDGKVIEAASLQQALHENPEAVITASIEARDLSSQLIRQEVEIARLPEPVKMTVAAMNSSSEIAFSLDETGTLSVKSNPVSKAMTSSVRVNGVTTWKWYGFNPETMNVYVNETKVDNPQTGKNFFGKTYVEVQVQGVALVQIEENGVLHHSEVIGAEGGNQVLYTDNTGAIDLTGPVIGIAAVIAGWFGFRFVKRRKAARRG